MNFLSEYVAGLYLIIYVIASLVIFAHIVGDKELKKYAGVEKRDDWADKCWRMSAWWPVTFLYLLYLRKKMNINSQSEA